MKADKNDLCVDDFLISPWNGTSLDQTLKILQEHDDILSSLKQSEPDVALFRELISTHERGRPLFRKSDNSPEAQVLVWLSEVKQAAELYSALRPIPKFSGLTVDQMYRISRLSPDSESISSLSSMLFDLGIMLLFEPQTKGMKLDGVVFRLPTGTPVVAMTLRYSRLDYFWFTLMHELAHINLHFDRLDNPIVEDLEFETSELIELEANKLAKDVFVPKHVWRNCPVKLDLKDSVLKAFAREQGIHPAIVAGMLRFELKRYDIFSRIINNYNVREVIFGYE